MPNTRRKSTIFQNPGGKAICLASLGQPTYCRANNLASQDASIPPQIPFETVSQLTATAAWCALELHPVPGAKSTSTVSLTLVKAGLSDYAVSAHPKRTVQLRCDPTLDSFFSLAAFNSDLLVLPGDAPRTRFNAEREAHVLEVVRIIASIHEAIRLGMLHGEQAIFDQREILLILRDTTAQGGGLR